MEGQTLDSYRWKSRLVLLFTPAPDSPVFLEQVRLLEESAAALTERKVVVIRITPAKQHGNAAEFLDKANSLSYYERFKPQAEQFELILVGLDGSEKLRKRNITVPVSDINDLIDTMPMRRQELRRNGGKQ